MQVPALQRLEAIEQLRRPLYKILLSGLESHLGHIFYRKPPPQSGETKLLHLGCGDHHFEGWINADTYRFSDLIRKSRGLPDWMLDASRPWNCDENYWDGIYTEHMLEHLDYRSVIVALKEARRALKSGAWLRIVVPGLAQALGERSAITQAEAVAQLTQTHGHLSVWDPDLMSAVLREIGFHAVNVVSFQNGSDNALIKDLPERQEQSFYIEAQK